MKAFLVTSEYSDHTRLEFAETANKARSQCAHADEFHDVGYQDLRAYRARQFDGRETNPPTWEELVRDHGWKIECSCGLRVEQSDNPEWQRDICIKCNWCRKRCENCDEPIRDDQWCCSACFPYFNGDRFTSNPRQKNRS